MSASATEPEILGELPAHVFTQLGIATSARAVWLGTDAITHIQHQRDVSRPDADVVLATLRRGVFNPVYCGLDHADVRRKPPPGICYAFRSRHSGTFGLVLSPTIGYVTSVPYCCPEFL